MKTGRKRFFRVVLPSLIMASVILVSYTYCHRGGVTKEQVLLQLITNTLNFAHYSPVEINDDFSSKAYGLYIKNMDYSKRFFTKEDLKKLEAYKLKIDDEIRAESFELYNLADSLFSKQVELVHSYYLDILSKPFEFKTNESYETDPDKTDFAQDNKHLKEIWRKTLKFQVLSRLNDMIASQEQAKAKSDTVKSRSVEEMEKMAREKVLKINDSWYKRLSKRDESDRFSLYLNAIVGVYDPHTQYFPEKEKKAFDIRMSGQLEGIGALLQETDEGYVRVAEIVLGSPSWLQGELQKNDLIMKVGQENQPMVDVAGMLVDDVVKLIRGKKGTKVTLNVKKTDGTIKNITITRDVVVIEETYAKSAIISTNGSGDKFGYIYLPEFYIDFDNMATGRSCAEDIAKELEKLKAENVKGVILDLRDNGGGSLADAVKMGGLFIKKGPIVQVKARSGPAKVLEDTDPSVQYGGPLVIMVNSLSASASEILAAAMQDYKRAIIIGAPSTFGKGTVQTRIFLDDQLNGAFQSMKPLGAIHVTIQKFYRINGGATQLKGVTPDIILPDIYSQIDLGEREQDYCMPWNQIAPVNYSEWSDNKNFPEIIKKENDYIASNEDFSIIKEEAKVLKKQKDQSTLSLNLETFKKDEKTRQDMSKRFDELAKKENGLTARSLLSDDLSTKNDTARIARNKLWLDGLKKDIYLKEAVRVVSEINSEK